MKKDNIRWTVYLLEEGGIPSPCWCDFSTMMCASTNIECVASNQVSSHVLVKYENYQSSL